MNEQSNDIDDLIGRVLAGEGGPEEQRELDIWLDNHPDNRAYFSQLKTIFEKAASSAPQLDFDTDAAWKKVRHQLQSDSKVRIVSFGQPAHVSTGAVLRMAASIVIIVGIGFFTYRWLSQPVETFALRTDKTAVLDTLPDGSSAFVNKGSALAFEYSPRKKTRRARLSGEAYFQVKHEDEKPFIISSEDVLIQDIGTAFNVKAYPESDTIEVSVQEGEVHFYTLNDAGLRLTAGEAGAYSKQSHQFMRLEKPDTNVLAYKTQNFSFNNADLGSILQKINEVYGSSIGLQNPALSACRLTVNFQGETIDTIVDVIAETLKLTVTRNGEKIQLDGPGCN
jgi:transmembrane sensor